jgi:hypothetical protein
MKRNSNIFRPLHESKEIKDGRTHSRLQTFNLTEAKQSTERTVSLAKIYQEKTVKK